MSNEALDVEPEPNESAHCFPQTQGSDKSGRRLLESVFIYLSLGIYVLTRPGRAAPSFGTYTHAQLFFTVLLTWSFSVLMAFQEVFLFFKFFFLFFKCSQRSCCAAANVLSSPQKISQGTSGGSNRGEYWHYTPVVLMTLAVLTLVIPTNWVSRFSLLFNRKTQAAALPVTSWPVWNILGLSH